MFDAEINLPYLGGEAFLDETSKIQESCNKELSKECVIKESLKKFKYAYYARCVIRDTKEECQSRHREANNLPEQE